MFMLEMSGGPYTTTRYYRVPMSKDTAKRVAQDFRRRIGCRARVVPFAD